MLISTLEFEMKSEVISIQLPLPNDIDNVKLYCIPRYVDFEARTNMAARR